MPIRLVLLFAALLLSAGSSTYKVQRAALVPHQQPNQRSGQPIADNQGELAIGTSTLSVITDPKEAPDANAGLYIPRVHLNGAARLRLNRRFDVGLLWDHGLDKGSKPIQDGQPKVDNGDVYGGGLTMFYAANAGSPEFHVGIGLDLLMYSIPYVEYRTCIDNCGIDPFLDVERDRDLIPVVALGITPSWRLSPELTAFGGVTARNHPTIPRTQIEGVEVFEDDEVEAGPLNFIANAGVEYNFTNGMRAMVHVFQPMFADPVRYGPTFGASFTIPLGRDPAPADPVPLTATARR